MLILKKEKRDRDQQYDAGSEYVLADQTFAKFLSTVINTLSLESS